MKIYFIGVISLLAVLNAHAFKRYDRKPGEQIKDATYYTDDGKYAVFLTLKERRTIERVLKPHTWADQDYRQIVDDKFIKRYTGGCCAGQCGKETCTDVSVCTSCSADAKLFIEVMNDFKGKNLEILFSQLNLRREL